tara:strand:- start:318 stop:602 length:285 start_codon:yes stop_codon:yes gene_type:complete
MSKKSVKLYADHKGNVLDAFYEAIRTNSLGRLHIPHSDVFYVKAAVEAHYGRPFTLQHVEEAMLAEGWSEQNRSLAHKADVLKRKENGALNNGV